LHAWNEKINAYRVLVEKPEGNGRFGRPGDNINMDLGELGWEDVSWIHFSQVGTSGGAP
jgi:hypothetical protein